MEHPWYQKETWSDPWYKRTELGDMCGPETHCPDATEDGACDTCDTIDGRWVQAVSDYASTCDGCQELTHHEEMSMDVSTQLGYCEKCTEERRG